MEASKIISLVLGLFGLMGLLAFALSWIKAKMNESQMEMLRKDRDDLIIRLEQRDETIAERDKAIEVLGKKVETLESQIEFLTQMATGKAHTEALLTRFQQHDVLVADRYNEYITKLSKMIEAQQRIEHLVLGRKDE